MASTTSSRVRGAAVLTAATSSAGALVALAGPTAAEGVRATRTGGWSRAPLDQALTWCCAALSLVVVAWVWVLVVSIVLEVLSGNVTPGAPNDRTAVGALRRAVLAVCGVAVVGGLGGVGAATAAPSAAAPFADRPAVTGPESPAAVPDRVKATASHPDAAARAVAPSDRPGARVEGLPLPDRPTGGPGAGDRDRRTRATVRVGVGDSLWSIAAEALPRSATPSAIDDYWRAVYAANPGVGPDPDVLRPGAVLRLPPADRPPEERNDR